MRFHPHDRPIDPGARGAALALGTFDGVHLGHQAVIASAGRAAARLGGALGVSVFAPHPRLYFRPDAPPFLIQNRGQMLRALSAHGVDEAFEIGFDQDLATLSADAFAERILAERIGAAHVSAGFNFNYGYKRGGDVETLRAQGGRLGFGVEIIEPIESADLDRPVSSTSIRALIGEGDMARAARLLGRPWAIEGEVRRGFQRGRELGFPTANLGLGDYVRPRFGVYAVNVHVGDGDWRGGVASVGVNPTVGALEEPVLEAHLFAFDADLYGKTIEVELIAFLREERRFPNLDDLKAQIARDAEQAQVILSDAP